MLWFTDGWKEFSESHSIDCGFVVVFNYEGNSKFKVLIFDFTATEIYNPQKSLRGEECGKNVKTDSNEQQHNSKCEGEEELLGGNDSSNDSMMQANNPFLNAVNASLMFKPNNPFFTKVMLPYNVQRSYMLHLPSIFTKTYLHGLPDSIQLEVSGGKRWTVHCVPKNGIVRSLSRGWNQFVKDNNLGEGDVCVFELIQINDVVLKVSIFSVGEPSNLKT